MLGHRLRRWPNIEPTLVPCLVFVLRQLVVAPQIETVHLIVTGLSDIRNGRSTSYMYHLVASGGSQCDSLGMPLTL